MEPNNMIGDPRSAKKRLDSTWGGFVCGMTAPWLTLFIFYLFKYNHITFSVFFNEILLARNILTAAISLCVITNLLVFFIFIWTNRNLSARGVIFSTIVYACYVVYQKYIL